MDLQETSRWRDSGRGRIGEGKDFAKRNVLHLPLLAAMVNKSRRGNWPLIRERTKGARAMINGG